MKFIFFLLILASLTAAAADIPIRNDGGSISYATEDLLRRRGELVPPPDIYQLEELNRVLFSELKNQGDDLRKVKLHLINGETRLARIHLTRLAYTNTKLKPVINRYLAILTFIEGQFQKSYNYLSLPELQNIPHYGKICVLKILNLIVLNKTDILEDEWVRCQLENPENFKDRNLIWLDTLVKLKLNPRPGITKVPFQRMKLASLNVSDAKVMIKLALYLNQEELILDQLDELTVDQLQDPDLREIVGHVYFRTGKLAKAYRFVEDLNSPNAENIKGNLYLLREKIELAYAQFKLALDQKQNSQNALERLLPLAWLLGDWKNGIKYSNQILVTPETQMSKMTLRSAFLMQAGEYEEAKKVLDIISYRSRRGTELEVTQLASFTALMLNRSEDVQKQSFMSCAQYDIINCWLMFQIKQWDSFALTIRRKESIERENHWQKLIETEIDEPLEEKIYVNQIDIEEMDDKLIQLIPSP